MRKGIGHKGIGSPGKAAALLGALALLLTLAAAAPLAQATYEPLGSGQTRLTLDRSFLGLLKQNGVKLSAVSPAKLEGATVSFPISGGKLDPTSARGTIEHGGALLFKAGKRSIPIKAPQLKTTQRSSPFSAKVGGSQLKLAAAQSLNVTRAGFASKVRVTDLTLSAKLATRLAKKLRLRGVIEAGQPFGSALTKADPETIALLPKGKLTFVLDPAIRAKLASLFVALNPIFPAERPADFTLPIAGGTIAPDGTLGTIAAEGALELLQLGGGQLFWREPWLDLESRSLSAEAEVLPSPPYGGKVGRVGVAGLGAASVSANPKARSVTVSGASLALNPETAASFEELFARPQDRSGVFVAGEALGSVSFVGWGE